MIDISHGCGNVQCGLRIQLDPKSATFFPRVDRMTAEVVTLSFSTITEDVFRDDSAV